MKHDNHPSVSVVMATYNGEKYLPEQIRSILDELLPDDELIVVDDCSQDGTLALLESLATPAMRVLRNTSNAGVRITFERGLAMASRDIVFLCDQDDVWLPGKRAAFVAEFQSRPETLIMVSDAQLIDANGVVIAPSFMATKGGFRGDVWSTLVRNRYLGCAMAFRRELLNAALPIPRRAPMHDMWIGAIGAALGKVKYLPEPWLQYRRHGGNVSPSRRQGWLRMLRWRLALITALAGRLLKLAVLRHAAATTSNRSNQSKV